MARKTATTAVGAVVFGGLAYGLLDDKIKHAMGYVSISASREEMRANVKLFGSPSYRIDKPGYNAPAGKNSSAPATAATHSHYGAGASSSGSPTSTTSTSNQVNFDSSSDSGDDTDSSSSSAIFAGENLTDWPDQPVSSSSVSRRRVKRGYGTQKMAEVFHGSGKELVMGLGAAAVMVVAMSALGHALSGKSAATAPTAPAGKHSHYSTSTAQSDPGSATATSDDQIQDQDPDGPPPSAIGGGGQSSGSKETKAKKKKHTSSDSPPASAIMKRDTQ